MVKKWMGEVMKVKMKMKGCEILQGRRRHKTWSGRAGLFPGLAQNT
jgi:hypothetical protein